MNLKRQLSVLLALLCFSVLGANAQVVQGKKVPQLDATQRGYILTGGNEFAKGQLIYNTEINCLEYWNGTEWVSLCDKGVTPSCTPIATVGISPNTSQSKTLDCMGSLKLITDASIEFTASAAEATSYEWYVDGAKQAEVSATFVYTTPTSTGDHSVYVKAINDCSEESSAPVTVSINQDTPPTVSITSTTTSVCVGSNLTMTATPEDGTWSSGTPATATIDATSGLLSAAAAGTTVITYTYTDTNGCTGTDTKTITVSSGTCEPDVFVPSTANSVVVNGVTFMTYNLGADPTMTPKEQMAYPADCPTDMTVYGGWYQWGRGDNAHTFRCDPTPAVDSDPRFTTTQYTSPGQPTGTDPLRSQFIYGGSTVDWKNPSSSTTDKLWGNNLYIESGGNNAAGNKGPTDPCPAGWRVPTQHEWALIGNEGGDILDHTNDDFSVTGSEFTPNSGIVWVKVNNKVPSTTFALGSMCGYALYTTDEWNSDKPKADLTAPGAPDPLLFLPAAGWRDPTNGAHSDVGTGGNYWSSTINASINLGNSNICADFLYFYNASVSTAGFSAKANGFSVRCVAEPACTPVTPSVSIDITSGSNPTCSGNAITFTATPTNGGTTPTYQWKVNGGNMGTNSPTFTYSAPANNAVVTCEMTSDEPCASTPTATSTGITVEVSGVCDAGSFPIPATPVGVPITVKGTISGGDFVGSDTPDATKTLTFMTHNLGADPTMTPKEQMAYPADCPADMTVYGGWYQWGRGDSDHTFRCAPYLGATNDPRFTTTQYTSPGQPTGTDPLRLQFIYNDTDWKNPSSSTTDKLWGNNLAAASGGNNAAGNKGPTDPCPAGWRVPTEHEWALIGNEGGSMTSTSGDYFSGSGSEFTPNSGIVWVRVNNKVPSTDFTAGNMCGMALYTTDEWNSGKPKTDLTAPGAPNPLLFLPAAGYRYGNSGILFNVGRGGIYWSSTINSATNACYLYFNDSTGNIMGASASASKAFGYSVRCIAEP